MELLNKEIKKTCQNFLAKPLDKIIESAQPTMWASIRELYGKMKVEASKLLEERLKGFDMEKDIIEKKEEELDDLALVVLKERFREKIKYLHYMMMKRFEHHFSMDENGIPRRWKPKDDIASVFKDAKARTENLLESFAILRLTPELDSVQVFSSESNDNFTSEYVILSEEEYTELKEKFDKETKNLYLQAVRDQENIITTSQIPAYIFLLIFVLGFNEFIFILTSPMLLFLTILIGISLYVIYLLNLGGPAQKIFQTVLQTSLAGLQRHAADILQQYQQNQQNTENKPKSD